MATKPDVHTWNLPDYDVDVTDDERGTWPDALYGLQPAQLFHVATTFTEPLSVDLAGFVASCLQPLS